MTPDARLRQTISRLFDAPREDHIVLAPGILVALRLLLPALRVRSLAFGRDEYYDLGHFPGFKAGNDATIASVVTWKGDLRPLPRAKLLIADATHIGAAGFPSVRALDADIVVGDAAKWIAPPAHESRIAWLWFRRPVPDAFARLYLATATSDSSLCSRWVSPADVRVLNGLLSGLSRRDLLARHEKNLALRENLTGARGLTAMTMLKHNPGIPPSLAWRTPRGWRVCFRADARS